MASFYLCTLAQVCACVLARCGWYSAILNSKQAVACPVSMQLACLPDAQTTQMHQQTTQRAYCTCGNMRHCKIHCFKHACTLMYTHSACTHACTHTCTPLASCATPETGSAGTPQGFRRSSAHPQSAAHTTVLPHHRAHESGVGARKEGGLSTGSHSTPTKHATHAELDQDIAVPPGTQTPLDSSWQLIDHIICTSCLC